MNLNGYCFFSLFVCLGLPSGLAVAQAQEAPAEEATAASTQQQDDVADADDQQADQEAAESNDWVMPPAVKVGHSVFHQTCACAHLKLMCRSLPHLIRH